MDLSQLDTRAGAEAGFALRILHPISQEPLDIVITVRGEDSDAYQEGVQQILRQREAVLARTKEKDLSFEQKAAMTVDLLSVATMGWEGITWDGQPFPYSPENARKLYAHPGFKWLRQQVDAAIGDRANFLPGSAKP